MKKVQLKARELKKAGIGNADASLINKILQKHYPGLRKPEALELLRELTAFPSLREQHPLLSEVLFPAAKKAPERPQKLREEPVPYTLFGKEYIDPKAIQQMELAVRLPVAVSGALMPDAHAGYGLPIGGVLATENAVIPFGVGMDIGCRVCLSVFAIPPEKLSEAHDYFKKILIRNTFFGDDYFKGHKEHPVMDREEFREIPLLKKMKDKAYEQLGTSGHGNHFVDIGIVEVPDPSQLPVPPGLYVGILSHSGSRNLGAEIARYYTRIAREKCGLTGEAGNLSWLDLRSAEGQEYWKAMTLAGDYAAANHELIHRRIAEELGEPWILRIENHHNFAWKEKDPVSGREVIIHRKGATPAAKNDTGVIPGTMIAPGYLVRGRGNPLSLHSSSHGAGRRISRTQARSQITKKELYEMLQQHGVELIGGDIDEAPTAYKDIGEVMSLQAELVDILAIFRPKIVRMC
ncbi:MAG: RtcB family protein [Bacteroidales bacterium]|nr:RtcB family protein [Bacteroidales bacterium]